MNETLPYCCNPQRGVPLFQNQRFFLQAFDVVDELGVSVIDIRYFFREGVYLLINRIIVGVQLFLVPFEVFAARPGTLRNPSSV